MWFNLKAGKFSHATNLFGMKLNFWKYTTFCLKSLIGGSNNLIAFILHPKHVKEWNLLPFWPLDLRIQRLNKNRFIDRLNYKITNSILICLKLLVFSYLDITFDVMINSYLIVWHVFKCKNLCFNKSQGTRKSIIRI